MAGDKSLRKMQGEGRERDRYVAAFNKRDLDATARAASERRILAEQLRLSPPVGSQEAWDLQAVNYVGTLRRLQSDANKATQKSFRCRGGNISKACDACHVAHEGKR